MMNTAKMIEILPTSVKMDVIGFKDVRMKTGKMGVRITIDRLLTDDEKEAMSGNKHIVGLDGVAVSRYSAIPPRSYFYMV